MTWRLSFRWGFRQVTQILEMWWILDWFWNLEWESWSEPLVFGSVALSVFVAKIVCHDVYTFNYSFSDGSSVLQRDKGPTDICWREITSSQAESSLIKFPYLRFAFHYDKTTKSHRNHFRFLPILCFFVSQSITQHKHITRGRCWRVSGYRTSSSWSCLHYMQSTFCRMQTTLVIERMFY